MTLHLPESIKRSVHEVVQSNRFSNVDEALAAAWIAYNQSKPDQPALNQNPASPAIKPIWEEIQELTAGIPDEEFLKLLSDGAVQHDHYLYGLPKRPVS